MLAESSPVPVYDHDGITLYHGDCTAILPWLSARSVDHLITDPPYPPHVHANGRRGDATSISAARDLEFVPLTDDVRRLVASEAARLVRRWSIVFCALESIQPWITTLAVYGLPHVRTGIWVKLGAAPQFTGDRPANGAEGLVIAHPRGRSRWNGGGRPAVWQYPVVNHGRLHPAEKPLRLMYDLVQQFTEPTDLILDPFAGSGTTLRAALDLGRRAVGIELDAEHCATAIDRLRQRVLPSA